MRFSGNVLLLLSSPSMLPLPLPLPPPLLPLLLATLLLLVMPLLLLPIEGGKAALLLLSGSGVDGEGAIEEGDVPPLITSPSITT